MCVKKNTFVALLAVILLLAVLPACVREETPVVESSQSVLASNEAVLSFTVKDPGVNQTKSVISASEFDTDIKSIFILVVGSDNQWKKCYSSSGNAGLSNFVVKADGSTYYDIYAFVNMGNINIGGTTAPYIPVSGGIADPESFVYTLPDTFSDLSSTGLPMCGYKRLNASDIVQGSTVNVSVILRRLLSKVIVRVDKTSMFSGSTDGSALEGSQLKVSQVSKVLRPFASEANRRATSTSEMYSADTDWHNFATSDGQSLVSSQIVLYVPENRQGTGATGVSQQAKAPASGREELVTYLEYTADKSGASDGVGGAMVYRTYLGEDESEDFNIIGDRIYSATLSLSWNGMWEGAWRVSSTSFTDSRVLVISNTENSSTGITSSSTNTVKIRKSEATSFYLNYFVNGASSPSHGRKDVSDWPYGWVLYLDGDPSKMTGTSGTYVSGSTNVFSWTYNSSNDRLALTAAAGAPAGEVHTLQLRTVDGRQSSDLVYFTTTIPFDFGWLNDVAPNHVAQINTLRALDPDTHAVDPEGVFHLDSNYSSYVNLTDNGDGTAKVELLQPFANFAKAIYITDADDDRRCDVPLESRLPYFENTSLGTGYLDASQTVTFTYYSTDADGNKTSTPMQITSDETATGTKLNLSLVKARINPVLTCDNGKLSFPESDLRVNDAGKYEGFVHVHTYEGLSPSGATFTVDRAKFSLENYESSRSNDYSDFVAYNPWKFVSDIPVEGPLMNDYTLYRAPARQGTSNTRVGWNTNPSDKPSETTSTIVPVSNIVVSNSRNLKFDAKFEDGSGYVGEKIASGTPGIVSHDFNPGTTYMLKARITNTSNFDYQRLGDYLYYEQGHYITSEWLTMPESQKRGYLVEFITNAGGSVGLSGYHPTAAEAWTYAPSGVTSSNPTAIQGTEFFIEEKNLPSTWDLTYSMNGLTCDDIKTHSAGLINVVLKVVNPFNSSSPTLDKIVSQAYMRLHLWVWASVTGVSTIYPGYSETQGWAYHAYPYMFTDNKPIWPLENLIRHKSIIRPQQETYTSASTTYLRGSGASLNFGGDYYGDAPEMTWQFRNDNLFNDSSTEAEKRAKLMTTLSTNEGNSVFLFRISDNQTVNYPDFHGPGQSENVTYPGLDSVLGGSDYYHRESATCLYYDPSGSAHTYVHGDPGMGTNKLFVIYIGETVLCSNPYFFDPNKGYVNP